jgi:Zn-dependent alcohol dehydrogenase
MKTANWLSIALAPLFLVGCQGMSHTDKGVLGGAAIGTGVGAAIGSATKNTGAGAVIGGLAGGLAGGLVGNSIDETEKRQEARLAAAQAAQPPAPPLGLTDIVQMAQQRISDSIIIQQIRTTHSVYHLSPADLQWLNANGVSDAVVMEMQATATRAPKRVYGPPPVRERIVVVEPPPPVGIGIGFGYHHHPRRRGW